MMVTHVRLTRCTGPPNPFVPATSVFQSVEDAKVAAEEDAGLSLEWRHAWSDDEVEIVNSQTLLRDSGELHYSIQYWRDRNSPLVTPGYRGD